MSNFDPFDPDDQAGVFNPRGGMHEPPEIVDMEERQEIYLNAVQTLTNALGGWEWVADADNGKGATIYRPGDSVLPVLKDLKKLWRKDDTDDERTVARCMHQAGLMKELVSLVCEVTLRGEWGRKVALMAFDLIAALTWPIDVAKELKELEDEGPIVTDYATLLRAQVEYKATIIASDTLRCLLSILVPIFAKERRNDKDERIISLGLHVVRNLLAIRDVVAPDSATGEKEELSTLQSQLLVQLDKLTYMELFNTLASQADRTEFNPFNMLILDINHLIFRCIKPEQLVKDPERAPVENLTKLLDGEKRKKAVNTHHRATRHSRFGTTLSARANGQKIVLHAQNAINEDVGQALDNNKRKRAARLKRMDELTVDVYFSADALRVTQKFAKDFVEGCFNDFIASVLKDIRMERSKVRPADTIRALFVAAYAMEYLILLRKKTHSKAEAEGLKAVQNGVPAADIEDPSAKVDQELPLGLAIEMVNLDSVRWVVSRMKISMESKPVAWTELQASIECFTYILLLIDNMSHSRDKTETDAAQTLQDQLYYNGDILDACLEVVSQYKDQSVAYLDSVIMFAYVLLRMLERYSKNKQFMFVRKQTARRKKNKAQRDREDRDGVAPVPEEYENDSEDEDIPMDDGPSYAEHAFTFTKFEKRFASEGVCNTLLAYLQRYKELDADQLRRVVGLIHRQVVKAQAEGLYFQVSSLALFRNIMDSKLSLPNADSSKDLIQLVTFIVRKFFKRLKDDPFLMIEALMPKSRGRWKELSSWEPDAEDMAGQRARIREQLGPAKLDFIKKRDLSTNQKIGALVKYFIENNKEDYVNWLITIMELVLAERREVILTTDGEDALVEDEPSEEARKKIPIYYLRPSDEKHIEATKEDSHFRLLLETVGFWNTESEPSEAEGAWVYPPSDLPSTMEPLLQSLKDNLAFPPTDLGDMKTLVRRVYKRHAASDSGSEPEDDGDGEGASARPKRKRRRRDDDGPRPRRAQKAKEVQTYKSAAFIWDSDDDDEADAAFFAREAELRAAMGKAGQDAENEVRAIMAGKTLRKPVRRASASPSEDGSASEQGEAQSESGLKSPGVLPMLMSMRAENMIKRRMRMGEYSDGLSAPDSASEDEKDRTLIRTLAEAQQHAGMTDAEAKKMFSEVYMETAMKLWELRHGGSDSEVSSPPDTDDDMEGPPWMRRRRHTNNDFNPFDSNSDDEFVKTSEWRSLRRDIMREIPPTGMSRIADVRYDNGFRPSNHPAWRGPWTERDEDEFWKRREGVWESASDSADSISADEGFDEEPLGKSDDDIEDKENQPPLRMKSAAEDRAEDKNGSMPSPRPRKSEPETGNAASDTDAAPVPKRRRVVESDDDD